MSPSPGALAVHPVALLALAVLVLNDHWAKARFPNALTGKLSDFAGLVLVPVVIVSTIELVRGRAFAGRPRAVTVACALTGALFAASKATHVGAELYRSSFGLMQWGCDQLISCVTGAPRSRAAHAARAVFARDPTDLVALIALIAPVWITRAVERGSRTPREQPAPRTREAAARE